MATKPTSVPQWATDVGATTEPGSLQKAAGWGVGQKPPAKWMNWLLNLIYLWIQYLNAPVGTGTAAAFDASSSTTATSAGLIGRAATTSTLGVVGLGSAVSGANVTAARTDFPTPILGVSQGGTAIHGQTYASGAGNIGVKGAGNGLEKATQDAILSFLGSAPGVIGMTDDSGPGSAGVVGYGAGGAIGGYFRGAGDASGLKAESAGNAPAIIAVPGPSSTRGSALLTAQTLPTGGTPVAGELAYDSNSGSLRVFNGTSWMYANSTDLKFQLNSALSKSNFTSSALAQPTFFAGTLRSLSAIEVDILGTIVTSGSAITFSVAIVFGGVTWTTIINQISASDTHGFHYKAIVSLRSLTQATHSASVLRTNQTSGATVAPRLQLDTFGQTVTDVRTLTGFTINAICSAASAGSVMTANTVNIKAY